MKNARTGWNASRLASERPLSKRKEHGPVGGKMCLTQPDIGACSHCGHHVCSCKQQPATKPVPAPAAPSHPFDLGTELEREVGVVRACDLAMAYADAALLWQQTFRGTSSYPTSGYGTEVERLYGPRRAGALMIEYANAVYESQIKQGKAI